jgi:hypothetical protein
MTSTDRSAMPSMRMDERRLKTAIHEARPRGHCTLDRHFSAQELEHFEVAGGNVEDDKLWRASHLQPSFDATLKQ